MDSRIEKSDHSQPGKPLKRAALVVSLLFHVALIAGLAFWIVNRRGDSDTERVTRTEDDTSASATSRPNPPRPSPDVTSAQVNNTLERMQEVYEEKPIEEKLTALEEKAGELEKLASEESIDEIAAKFQEWTNIQPRASTPAEEPVEGEFDFDTAQLHEVQRIDAEDGTVEYHGLLVDAQGRTRGVEMNAQEGETAYRTLESLKRFPLAERVYRQIAMPLIDRAAAASKNSNSSAGNTTQAKKEDDRDPFDGQLDDESEKVEESSDEADVSSDDAP